MLSAFSLALELLPGEVNVADVLRLEMLRHIAPRACSSLMEHQDFLTWVPDQYSRRGDKDWNAARLQCYKLLEEMADELRRQTVRDILKVLFPFVGMDAASVKD